MENQVLEALKNRRSVRKFSNRMVEQDKLDKIMEAATYAPTGMGKQSPTIVLVKNKEIRDRISVMNAKVMGGNTDPFYGAPIVAVVFGNKSIMPTWLEDAVLVAGNLLNAAHAVGVDSCYIYRAKEVFESEEGLALLKEWGLDENYIGVANCILGYREGDIPVAIKRKADYIIEV